MRTNLQSFSINIFRLKPGLLSSSNVKSWFEIKYFNNGENIVSAKINKKKTEGFFDTLNKALDEEGEDFILKKLGKKPEKAKHNPDDNKLELFIEGDKILHIEGRYNKKYHAMFYQALTRDFQSFHFYIKLMGRAPIALNMGLFNTKIDKAVRKAKEKIADEYDVSMDVIDKIIEEKNLEVVELDSINAGDCTFHFGWTIHGAGLNKSDKIREAMVVTYYADGSRVGKLDTKDRKGDAELFLGGKKAGEIADHPMNKIVYQR